LLLFSMLTAGVGIVLVCTGFVLYDIHEFRAKKVSDLEATAQLLNMNANSALGFNDPSAGDESVQAMRMQPGIRVAVLYQEDGRILAWYLRRDLTGNFTPPRLPMPGVAWRKDALSLAEMVVLEGKPVSLQWRQLAVHHQRPSKQQSNYSGENSLQTFCAWWCSSAEQV
jgi:Periplasmic sensor domain